MKHHPTKHSIIVHIYLFYNSVHSLGQSIGYNHENIFVQTLNSVFKVITFVGEN